MKKNLILGAIKGYNYEKLKIFVKSIRNTSFEGDVCILANTISSDTHTRLANEGILVNEMNYRGNGAMNSWSRFWPFIRPMLFGGINPFSRFILKKILPLQTVRFFHYKDFLIKNKGLYKEVLLTDVRDVFFQTDPFSLAEHSKVQCYEEFLTIGQEQQYNGAWIRQLFGDESLLKMQDFKILCSGTILGPVEEIIKLIDRFEKLIIKAQEVTTVGSDQGVFNYLVRNELLGMVDILAYGDGEVLTVSNQDDPHKFYKDLYLYNLSGLKFGVVHQYDRSSKLESQLLSSL